MVSGRSWVRIPLRTTFYIELKNLAREYHTYEFEQTFQGIYPPELFISPEIFHIRRPRF